MITAEKMRLSRPCWRIALICAYAPISGVFAQTSSDFVLPGYTRIDTALYYEWRNYDISLNAHNPSSRNSLRALVSPR